MAVNRWDFFDPSTSQTYEFEINPNAGGSPSYEHNYQYVNTAAPDGKVLVYEGRDSPKKLNFSGTLLTQTHFEAFVTWWSKKHQITVTDDLNRTFTILIDKFTPRREKASRSPWKHSYEVEATIVDWPT